MSEASPILKGALKPEKPCNVLRKGGKAARQPTAITMDDLISRTRGVSLTATEIKEFIKNEIQESNLPPFNYISKEEYTVTDERKTKASENITSALKDHFHLLAKLTSYTEYARTKNSIGQQQERPETLKGKLLDVEEQLYQIMCDIEIALLGKNDTVNMTGSDNLVSAQFKKEPITKYNETKRAYYLMNDCQQIMGYLKAMYNVM